MTNLNTEHEDNPRFTVEELLSEFDLTLDPAPSFPRISGAILDEHTVFSNPHFLWLVEQGLLARNSKPSNDWYKMVCPLAHEHTDGDESGTGIRFAADGRIAFHCFHSHGDKFRTKEYLEWVRQENGPTASLTASFTWDEPDLLLLEPERGPLPEAPLEVLPPKWREWVKTSSEGAGAPAAFVLQGLLASTAAVCGAGIEIQIGASWPEPGVLWLMMVAAPSSGKSPALTASRRLFSRVDAKLKGQNLCRELEYSSALRRFDEAKAARGKKLDKTKTPAPLPPKPEKPHHLQLVVGNTTIEALAAALSANPRGLIAIHDELSSLLLNLSRYSGGNDRPLYLEAWAAASWTINRKHLDKPIEIARAAVSMLGGMQPEKLREFFDDQADDGLAARFLYAWPDPPTRVPLYKRRGADDAWASAAIERIWQTARTPANPLVLAIDARAFDPVDERLENLARREEGFIAGFVGKDAARSCASPPCSRSWSGLLPPTQVHRPLSANQPWRALRGCGRSFFFLMLVLSFVSAAAARRNCGCARRHSTCAATVYRLCVARPSEWTLCSALSTPETPMASYASSSTAASSGPYIAQPLALDGRRPSGRLIRAFSINRLCQNYRKCRKLLSVLNFRYCRHFRHGQFVFGSVDAAAPTLSLNR